MDSPRTPLDVLAQLVDAAETYSPRDEHDWRCEYRTEKVGWKEGDPPVIRCECGRAELDAAIDAARLCLQSTDPSPEGKGEPR